MLTFEVIGRGILDKSGNELPLGAKLTFKSKPSEPWASRLRLLDGVDAKEHEIANNEPEQTTDPAPDEPTPDEAGEEYGEGEEIDLDELDDEQVRQLAKEYGIKSWHNKGIDKLKEELSQLDDDAKGE